MKQSNNYEDDKDEVLWLAKSMDLPYPVYLSQELSEQIKPNEFLTTLGIQYSDRIKTILSVLQGKIFLKKVPSGEMTQKGIVLSLTLAKGPFIKEELISIRAEMKDEGGETVIYLTALPEED